MVQPKERIQGTIPRLFQDVAPKPQNVMNHLWVFQRMDKTSKVSPKRKLSKIRLDVYYIGQTLLMSKISKSKEVAC